MSAKVLIDSAATWPNIRHAIDDTAGKTRPEDVVLIYFAGHGIALERRYYLLPHDMRSEATLDEDVKKFEIPTSRCRTRCGRSQGGEADRHSARRR